MMQKWWTVAIASAVVGAALAQANAQEDKKPLVASPKEMPPAERTKKIAERDLILKKINALRREKKFEEAVRGVEEMMALEKTIFGAIHQELADSWGLMAKIEEARQGWQAALAARQKAFDIVAKLYNADDARVFESADKIASTKLLSGLSAEDRETLQKANDLEDQATGNDRQAKFAESAALDAKALELRTKILGPDHPLTLDSLNALAIDYGAMGKLAEATRLSEKVMAGRRAKLGEGHPNTAKAISNVAEDYRKLGRLVEAEDLHQKALQVFIKAYGPDSFAVANSLNNLSIVFALQGRYAEAERLMLKALALRQKILGVEDFHTASAMNNLANILRFQGKWSESLHYNERTLAISLKLLGPDHPQVARTYGNLSTDFQNLDKYEEAERYQRKSIELLQKAWGSTHPDVITGHLGLGVCLYEQKKYQAAYEGDQKALTLAKAVLGEDHPETIVAVIHLGTDLRALGRFDEAANLYRKALTARRKLFGTDHANGMSILRSLARVEYFRGNDAEAEKYAVEATKLFSSARLAVSYSGLGRAGFGQENSPLLFTTAILARNGKALEAWKTLETHLSRGLFDDLSARQSRSLTTAERQRQESLLNQLDIVERSLSDQGAKKIDEGTRQTLQTEHSQLLAQLREDEAQLEAKYGVAAGQAYDLAKIQASLPPRTAMLAWVDVSGHDKARDPSGEHWACLIFSKGDPQWVRMKGKGAGGVWTEADVNLPYEARKALIDPDVEWKEILAELDHQRLEPLQERLKDIDHLVLLPSAWMTDVPLTALTKKYRVSYVPSGTIYAWLQAKGKKASHSGPILALGDPTFTPDSSAIVANLDIPKSLRGSAPRPLPATRREVQMIADLITDKGGKAAVLLGQTANERSLNQLVQDGEMSRFRLLHLATHGYPDSLGGLHSYLALTPEDTYTQVGKLTAGQILRSWKLDADLVTLSACETARGQHQGGEGYVGFAQALFLAGARTLVLSQWRVNDDATALLMIRFYQNLLGRRPGLAGPLAKGPALAEAQTWLAGLDRKTAQKLYRDWLHRPNFVLPAGRHPFAHPAYWAPFILVGDSGENE